MRIAVTGAYGQLGAELCQMLGDDALPSDVDSLDLTDARAVAEEVPIETDEEVRLLAATVEARLRGCDGLGWCVGRARMVRHGEIALQ